MSNKRCRTLCAIVRRSASIALIPILSAMAAVASAEEKEPVAVLELGGAGSWDVRGGASFGPSSAVEFEPIKNYLVMEAGVTPFFDNHGHADWDFDLLFRHPFDLTKKVEFEPGIGPTWSSSGQFGAQASFEFMIWPWQERKFGWFVDPSASPLLRAINNRSGLRSGYSSDFFRRRGGSGETLPSFVCCFGVYGYCGELGPGERGPAASIHFAVASCCPPRSFPAAADIA
jgi:hypothetical protein